MGRGVFAIYFTVATMTWSIVTEYMCHKLPRICSVFVMITIWSFPHSYLIIESTTRVTRPVLLVEQELITLPEHLRSLPVIGGVRVARSLIFCVVFCRSLFVLLSLLFCPLCCLSFYDLQILITPLVSCVHCVVCHSTIYRF